MDGRGHRAPVGDSDFGHGGLEFRTAAPCDHNGRICLRQTRRQGSAKIAAARDDNPLPFEVDEVHWLLPFVGGHGRGGSGPS